MAGQWVLFPDTNIFLHYPVFDGMDWKAICPGVVRLCLCTRVIAEIDEKKYDPHLSDRAQKVIRQVRDVRDHGGTFSADSIELLLLSHELEPSDFVMGLQLSAPDDTVIAHAMKYAARHSDLGVGVVSGDLGMQLKCSARNFPVFPPDEAQRLPTPRSEEVKRREKAEAELEKLRKRLPALTVLLNTKGAEPAKHAEVAITPIESFNSDDVLRAMVDAIPELHPDRNARLAMHALSMGALGVVPDSEYDRYNAERETYIEACLPYVSRLADFKKREALSFRLSLRLENKGSAPAEDVHVEFYFPNGFSLFNAGHGPSCPVPPKKPRKLQSELERLNPIAFPSFDVVAPAPRFPAAPSNVSAPTIKKTTSFDVTYHVRYLKHYLWTTLGGLEIWFDDASTVQPFEIQCRITAANLPRACTDTLHIVARLAEPKKRT